MLLAMSAALQGKDYTYTTDNGAIVLTRYTGAGGVVVVPGRIDGLPVTAIGNSAFCNCARLTSITLPEHHARQQRD